MEFRTEIKTTPYKRLVDYSKKGLAIGSCFAANMVERMQRVKLPAVCNPTGVLYNPLSVAGAIEDFHKGRRFSENDLEQYDDLWSCFSFHGSFSSPDPVKALATMNDAVTRGRKALLEADYVILTFGTAWVYEMKESTVIPERYGRKVVANCHKFPAARFERGRLEVGEIVSAYSELMEGALAGKHVILTVSPVRHLKEGFAGNSVSKAVLLLAVEELVEKYPLADYFPAYEIMNDDLRDYRFYSADMVHPSEAAVDYVWEKFRDTLLSGDTRELIREVERIVAAAQHRPFNPRTASHKKFAGDMRAAAVKLHSLHPEIDLTAEIEYFSDFLV